MAGNNAKIPTDAETARFNITLPAWLRRDMQKVEGVNWSKVAQEAFARFLYEMDEHKKTTKIPGGDCMV